MWSVWIVKVKNVIKSVQENPASNFYIFTCYIAAFVIFEQSHSTKYDIKYRNRPD